MKIALVHPAHMDYRRPLFEKLNDNYDVTFIFTKQGRGQGKGKEFQEKIPIGWNVKILKSDFIFLGKDVGMYLSLLKELLSNKYDIVITSTSWYFCWIAAKMSQKKFVFMIEWWCWNAKSLHIKILYAFTKYILKHSDAIFAMGTKAYNSSIEIGVTHDKLFMYPQCALDYSNQFTGVIKDKLGLQNKKVILYVGRVEKLKGIDYLLKSFSMLNNEDDQVFLIIVGDGADKSDFEKLSNQLDIKNIIFVGAIDKKEIASYYEACDVFVLPSIFYKHSCEGWGLVINEAMAFGKPIVTTNAVGAAMDLVENGVNGFVVGEKNTNELYSAMKYILSMEEIRVNMGKASRKIFEEKNNYNKMHEVMSNSIKHVENKNI